MSMPGTDSETDVEQRHVACPEQRTLTFREVLGSTFAAAFGVQSNANRVRDFTHGKFTHYLISGLIFVSLFVVGMIVVVRLVLSAAVS